jgi:hypothetical protein
MPLDDLINKVLSLVEKSQAQNASRQDQARSDYLQARDDKLWGEKLARIDLAKKQKEELANQRAIAELAHPISQLSGVEQRVQVLKDLEQKNKMYPGLIAAQEKDTALKAAQAVQASGLGAYYKSQADTQNVLRSGIEGLSPENKANIAVALPAQLPHSNAGVQPAMNSQVVGSTEPSPYVLQNAPIETYLPKRVDEREEFAASLAGLDSPLTLEEQLERNARIVRKPNTWLDNYNRPKSALGFQY